ncbi:MAG: TolC family protein [Planctomycetaceae bacterium]|nr:TolC family protein [Planctomycetaceae bacterium]
MIYLFLTTGCAVDRCAPGGPQVDGELHSRIQHGLGPNCCGETVIPGDVVLEDGIAPDEAVAVALWNNSAFNATLAQLGIARGDLIQAGLLRNPQFQLLLPGGTKQLEWALFLPIDAMLLRERRLDMTQREVNRVAEQLVQNGLDLVRDVRVAHADLALAHDRASLARDAVELRQRIADLTQKQLDAGDISELEATTAKIALKQAEADAGALNHAVAQAEARLKQLMSIGKMPVTLTPVLADPPSPVTQDLDSLVAEASSSRPDLRAATFAVAAAKHRAELARKQWLRFDAVADANSGGAGPSNFGPGLRFDIPIFDHNQGGVHSADWSVNQAVQNYNAIHDQIVADVQTSYSQYQQADENRAQLRYNVLTSLDEAVRLADKAFAGGGTSYFLVLQTTTQYLDARVREIQLTADLRRAAANLDRSVGRNLTWQQFPSLEPEFVPFLEEISPASHAESAESTSEPNIIILSKDGSALFSGSADRVRVGEALRRIADELEAGKVSSGGTIKPASFGDNSSESDRARPKDRGRKLWTPVDGLFSDSRSSQ